MDGFSTDEKIRQSNSILQQRNVQCTEKQTLSRKNAREESPIQGWVSLSHSTLEKNECPLCRGTAHRQLLGREERFNIINLPDYRECPPSVVRCIRCQQDIFREDYMNSVSCLCSGDAYHCLICGDSCLASRYISTKQSSWLEEHYRVPRCPLKCMWSHDGRIQRMTDEESEKRYGSLRRE